MNIILIGFMGAGKTTIGRRLAQRLGYRFVNMDTVIEEQEGMAISELFERKGEDYFRQEETKLLEQLQGTQNTIIATGGGTVKVEGNLELMKQIGSVVYLKASVADILERVMRNNKRPLLQTEDPQKTIETLLAQREPLYQQADLIVSTEGMKPYHVGSYIIQNI